MRFITTFDNIFTIECLLRKVFPDDPQACEYRGKIYTSVLGGKVEFGRVKDQKWLICAEDSLRAVVFVSFRNGGSSAYICFLASDPAFKGRGLGGSLLGDVIKHVSCERHVTDISLSCYDHLLPFYEKMGFKKVNRKHNLNFLEYRAFTRVHISSENNPNEIVQAEFSKATGMRTLVQCKNWEDSDIVWKPTGRGITTSLINTLVSKGSLINHFPDSVMLTNKKNMEKLLEKHFPDQELYGDIVPPKFGFSNPPEVFGSRVWISKPSNMFGGTGIEILDDVIVAKEHVREGRIVQKYLEKPLLIKGKKFDLRVLVLLTPTENLIYKHCYMRKCAIEYNLTDLENSRMHLTNTCYQIQTINKDQDMNSLHEEGDLYIPVIKNWLDRIVSWMAKIINQRPKCCFELFGLDIILDENSHPWLLEINTNPSLDMSTEVTKRFVPKLLNSTFNKVVRNIDTGSWYNV